MNVKTAAGGQQKASVLPLETNSQVMQVRDLICLLLTTHGVVLYP